ncbi:transposase-like protein [Pedobacter sp. UYP24]
MSKEVSGKRFGRLYLESFKQDIVKEAELEGSLALVCERHGISKTAIQDWMKQYGSAFYHAGKRKRRSLSEREGIAREIVSGHLSIEDAMLKYNVNDRDTVSLWLRQYKKRQQELLELLPQANVLAELESLPGSASELKLAELKIRALEVMLDIASKEFKVDIRKKFGAKP